MAYPAGISLPPTWEIRPEEAPRCDGRRVTSWRILDGEQPVTQYLHKDQEAAQSYALRLAELDAVKTVLEQAIGQTRHYGIRVWSEPVAGRSTPRWLITDPHTGQQDFAFAWYSPDPPPVEVYTRDQYELACAALDIDPACDSDLGSYWDKYGVYDLFTYTPKQAITARVTIRKVDFNGSEILWRFGGDQCGRHGLGHRCLAVEE